MPSFICCFDPFSGFSFIRRYHEPCIGICNNVDDGLCVSTEHTIEEKDGTEWEIHCVNAERSSYISIHGLSLLCSARSFYTLFFGLFLSTFSSCLFFSSWILAMDCLRGSIAFRKLTWCCVTRVVVCLTHVNSGIFIRKTSAVSFCTHSFIRSGVCTFCCCTISPFSWTGEFFVDALACTTELPCIQTLSTLLRLLFFRHVPSVSFIVEHTT